MTSHRLSRMPHRFLFVTSLLFVLLGTAVVPTPAEAGVVGYLRDRGEDFLDIFRLRFAAPYRAKGYGAKARVTALAQAGYVHFEGDVYGLDRRAIGHTAEKRTEGGVSLVYGSVIEMRKIAGNQYLDPESQWSRAASRGIVRNGGYWDDGRLHPLSLGAELHVGLFGLEIGFYPTEAVDFVSGFLFLDPFKDDRSFTDRAPIPAPDFEGREAARSQSAPQWKKSEGGETFLLPLDGEMADSADEFPLLTTEELDSTLGSGFVSPADLREFQEAEAPPGMETIETPVGRSIHEAPSATEPE